MEEQQLEESFNVNPELVVGYLKNEVAQKVGELAMVTARNIELEQALRESQATIDSMADSMAEPKKTPTKRTGVKE